MRYIIKLLTIQRKKRSTLRQKTLHYFAAFLILMILFTFLSRAADSMTVAVVTVEQPSVRVIEHTVTADGKVMQNREQAVVVEEGIRIKAIYVNEGDSVQKGDLLLKFDLDHLKEVIQEVEKEIKMLELSNDAIEKNKRIQAKTQEAAIKRAQEDYQKIKEDSESSVNEAKRALDEAKQALKQYDKANTQDNDTDNTQNSKESSSNQNSDTKESLLADIEEKEAAYQEALKNQEEALESASRALEDANTPQVVDNTDEVNNLQINALQTKLNKLNKLKKKKGKITSPSEGIITDVSVFSGNQSTQEAAFRMADLNSGVRFLAQFSKSDEKYLSKEASISLTSEGGGTTIDGYQIASIIPDTENADLLNVSVLITDRSLTLGQTATMSVTQTSSDYETTISLSALHESDAGQYVLVMQKKDTVLGEEWFAQKMNVTVLDKNESYAAIEGGALHENQSIIVSSNKSVEDGDRIRLAESDS